MKGKTRSLVAVIVLLVAFCLCGCRAGGYRVYQFDNGDDYLIEGLRRITDRQGKIGFADSVGNVAVTPQFAFAYPFSDGVAKATYDGHPEGDGEHSWWVSENWIYVDRAGERITGLEEDLRRCLGGARGRVGVAVIIDGRDTVMIRGREFFPMLSVYKFPQALALADLCARTCMALSDTISIEAREMKPDTWSPLRDRYGVADMRLPLSELLAFSMQQSDNNACDILFRLLGGTEAVDTYLRSLGIDDIGVVSTEDEMHISPDLCYGNKTTPLAMAMLMDRFNTELRGKSTEFSRIAELMESCATGTDRLAAPLAGTNATLGHKTGTGDRNGNGLIIAVNDAGYVNLPDGRRYSIAVFVSDTPDDYSEASRLIARLSAIVSEHLLSFPDKK